MTVLLWSKSVTHFKRIGRVEYIKMGEHGGTLVLLLLFLFYFSRPKLLAKMYLLQNRPVVLQFGVNFQAVSREVFFNTQQRSKRGNKTDGVSLVTSHLDSNLRNSIIWNTNDAEVIPKLRERGSLKRVGAGRNRGFGYKRKPDSYHLLCSFLHIMEGNSRIWEEKGAWI